MRPLLSPASVAVALALILSGCVEPSDGTPSSADLADFGVESTVTVRVDGNGFSPNLVNLPANSTITVINSGDDPHGVLQADTPPDRRIETGDLVPGESVDIHLAEPGLTLLSDPRTDALLTLDVGPAAPAD